MSTPEYRKARRHLSRKCAVMKPLIARVGPCTLVPKPDDPFTLIVGCVISQQISVKAAASLYNRLAERVKPLTAAKLRKLTADDFVACGISRPKQRAIAAILAHIAVEKQFLTQLPLLEDEAFRESVVRIKGLGPWSADMLLMFGFGRLDVLPVGDLGIKLAIRDLYGLSELPSVPAMLELSEPWRPYRTVASWYLWRSRDWSGEY